MGEWHEKRLEKVKEPKKGGPEPWKLLQEADGNVITPYHGLFNISWRPTQSRFPHITRTPEKCRSKSRGAGLNPRSPYP